MTRTRRLYERLTEQGYPHRLLLFSAVESPRWVECLGQVVREIGRNREWVQPDTPLSQPQYIPKQGDLLELDVAQKDERGKRIWYPMFVVEVLAVCKPILLGEQYR